MNRRDALVATLAERSTLLVVDNCEHVLAGARTCIVDLLASCPSVHVLATSRTRLLCAGEIVFAVPGLSLDDAGRGDAADLFVTRAADGRDARRAGRRRPRRGAGHLPAARRHGAGDRARCGACRQLRTGRRAPRPDRRARLPGAGTRHRRAPRARYVPRSTGATSCSTPTNNACCAAPACSPPRSTSMPPRPSPASRPSTCRRARSSRGLEPGRPATRAHDRRYRVLETIRQYATERAAELGELDAIRGAPRLVLGDVGRPARPGAPGAIR